MNTEDPFLELTRHLRAVYLSLFGAAFLLLSYQAWVLFSRAHLFLELYEGMGASLPSVTRLFLSGYRAVVFLPLLAVAGLAASFSPAFLRSRWSILAVVLCFSSSFFVDVLANHALYAPLLQLTTTLGAQ